MDIGHMVRAVTGREMAQWEKYVIAKIALHLRQDDLHLISENELKTLERIYSENRRWAR